MTSSIERSKRQVRGRFDDWISTAVQMESASHTVAQTQLTTAYRKFTIACIPNEERVVHGSDKHFRISDLVCQYLCGVAEDPDFTLVQLVEVERLAFLLLIPLLSAL